MKLGILISCLGLLIIETASVKITCYQCSWVGPKKLDKDYKETLDDLVKSQIGSVIPIHNPIVTPFISSPGRPTAVELQKNCTTCSVEKGYCVRWMFLVGDIPLNATYMCVSTASEVGHLTESMDSSLRKEVLICNFPDRCNRAPQAAASSLVVTCLLIALLHIRKPFG